MASSCAEISSADQLKTQLNLFDANDNELMLQLRRDFISDYYVLIFLLDLAKRLILVAKIIALGIQKYRSSTQNYRFYSTSFSL